VAGVNSSDQILDHFNYFSDDWFSDIEVKIMKKKDKFFSNKKILIYGLGKSGLASYNFLKNNNEVYVYDDYKIDDKLDETKIRQIKYKKISFYEFDVIIISPGIDITKCKLSKFLSKNKNKIITDLDVFYKCNPNNICITITGTNGKSTTCKILNNVLHDQKFDSRLVGNIGNPILNEKRIDKSTIFVIEASSYQLEYSKHFKSKYSVILNISPDHIERHKTLSNYVSAKFKLIKNQSKNGIAFVNNNNTLIKKKLFLNNFLSKIIKVNYIKVKKKIDQIKNPYFKSDGNQENLSFIFYISNYLKLNQKKLFYTLENFKGLDYRQQIVYDSKNLQIINDSKATSYASSESLIKKFTNAYWIIGGIPKQGDKFKLLKKDCLNIRAYIFGKYYKKFKNDLKNKIRINHYSNLKITLQMIFKDFRKDFSNKKKYILFSPAGASFDSFKNFEDRGSYFNKLIKTYINAR
jgi:UDP-N-acetylmuramoylalanine--D-glutamate ligase